MGEGDKSAQGYTSGAYWKKRSDLMYYNYVDYVMRTVGRDAKSVIDVGSGNAPYLDWFDWIERRVSVDIVTPYSSEGVEGILGNIFDLEFEEKFDICTCLQVLEHVEEAGAFAKRLFELGKIVIISVPHQWPANSTPGHVHDPVDLEKLTQWVGRKPDSFVVIKEPFRKAKGKRLLAVYLNDDTTAKSAFNFQDRRPRKPR